MFLKFDKDLHQRLLAEEVSILEIEKTSCVLCEQVKSVSNIPSGKIG